MPLSEGCGLTPRFKAFLGPLESKKDSFVRGLNTIHELSSFKRGEGRGDLAKVVQGLGINCENGVTPAHPLAEAYPAIPALGMQDSVSQELSGTLCSMASLCSGIHCVSRRARLRTWDSSSRPAEAAYLACVCRHARYTLP